MDSSEKHEGKYVCEKCGKSFDSLQSYAAHMRHCKRGSEGDGERKLKIKGEEDVKSMLSSLIKRIEAIEEYIASSKSTVIERSIEVGTEPKIRKTIELYPQTIQYYNWFIAKGKTNMSLDEFINETIDEHFRDCLGVEVGIIVRPRGGELRRER